MESRRPVDQHNSATISLLPAERIQQIESTAAGQTGFYTSASALPESGLLVTPDFNRQCRRPVQKKTALWLGCYRNMLLLGCVFCLEKKKKKSTLSIDNKGF